jgi:hypothetical protein
MTVVFDENVSHRLVELLAKCGAPGTVQHTRKLGWNGMEDLDWIKLSIKAGFLIISADRNARTRGLSADELKSLGARVLLLGPFWDALNIWEKTKWLVSRWDRLHAVVLGMPMGSCLVVGKGLEVTHL